MDAWLAVIIILGLLTVIIIIATRNDKPEPPAEFPFPPLPDVTEPPQVPSEPPPVPPESPGPPPLEEQDPNDDSIGTG
jgi:hypothetical protein